jgi:hypothetical protein
MERCAAIAEELAVLRKVPREAAAMLDRELERIAGFHTEKCCDMRLTAGESDRHKEARALARGLGGFFEKRSAALTEEMIKLRKG